MPYTCEEIDLLNAYGVLTSQVLMRMYGIDMASAQEILKEIANDYENVLFRGENLIYIEGRERDEWKPKPKTSRVRAKKRARWKDIKKL